MFDAIKNGDLTAANQLNARYRPIAQAFYSPPFLDMHNRMKEALVILGRLPKAVVRPPLMKLSDNEIHHLRDVLEKSGIRQNGAFEQAA